MAIKLVDELKAMGNFPIAHAEGINLVKTDGTEDNLQNLFDNKELGGGGDNSVTLTQQEYEALSEEQKLDGLYYTYDTKRIYKNGVQYGASDAEDIGYNNVESGIQATTVQGAIDKVVKTVEDDYVKKTEIPTTLPANGGNADTVNNHTVKSDVPENAVFTDTIYDDTEVKAEISKKADKEELEDYMNIKYNLLEPSTDLNTLTVAGMYMSKWGYSNSLVNKPSGFSSDYEVIVTVTPLKRIGNYGEYIEQTFVSRLPQSPVYRRIIENKAPTQPAWTELVTMDKVVPQVIIENKTTDDARTIIQNSWGAFPTNNSLAKIETSIFTWSAQIYKLDSSWGTIILTCYDDNKDSYIGKLSNKAWHWYKMGLTEV